MRRFELASSEPVIASDSAFFARSGPTLRPKQRSLSTKNEAHRNDWQEKRSVHGAYLLRLDDPVILLPTISLDVCREHSVWAKWVLPRARDACTPRARADSHPVSTSRVTAIVFVPPPSTPTTTRRPIELHLFSPRKLPSRSAVCPAKASSVSISTMRHECASTEWIATVAAGSLMEVRG